MGWVGGGGTPIAGGLRGWTPIGGVRGGPTDPLYAPPPKSFVPPCAEELLERHFDRLGRLMYKGGLSLETPQEGWFALVGSVLYVCSGDGERHEAVQLRKLQELCKSRGGDGKGGAAKRLGSPSWLCVPFVPFFGGPEGFPPLVTVSVANPMFSCSHPRGQ